MLSGGDVKVFTGFDLKIDKSFFETQKSFPYEYYATIGKTHLKVQQIKYKQSIKEFIFNDSIDGTKVQNEWFPLIKADVFISHSHKDQELAEALAGWIYEKFEHKVSCFIDANVWGFQDELLQQMNDDLSDKEVYPERTIYNYDSCNKVSQHVNAMLSIALQKMIDKTETVLFLNTENSIQITDGNEMSRTYSPWLYTEIVCSQIIRKKPLIVYRDYGLIHKSMYESAEMKMNLVTAIDISYSVSLQHLISIGYSELSRWEMKYFYSDDEQYPLDILYQITIPDVVEETKKIYFSLKQPDISLIKKIWSSETKMTDEQRASICEMLDKKKKEFANICENTYERYYCPVLVNRNCPYRERYDYLEE